MRTVPLMEDWKFNDTNPNAEPLLVAPEGRILRFALRPGQVVREHSATHSPVYIVVLKGHGLFAGADGKEQQFGPNALIIFDIGEKHSVRAEGEELVFVAFLREAPSVGRFPSRMAKEHKGRGRKA